MIETHCIYVLDPIATLLAKRCVDSGRKHGVQIQLFNGCQGDDWKKFPLIFDENHKFGGGKPAVYNCFSSHYKLWKRCAGGDNHFVILEHDAVVTHPFANLPTGDFLEVCLPDGPKWKDNVKGRGHANGANYHYVGKGGNPRGTTGYMVSPDKAVSLCQMAEASKCGHADLWLGKHLQRKLAILPYPVRCGGLAYSTIHGNNHRAHIRRIANSLIEAR